MNNEIWKSIKEFDGYEVSNLGNVRSWHRKKNGKILSPGLTGGYFNNRYRCVFILRNDGKYCCKRISVLVLNTFSVRPSKDSLVCHRDDNPKNDALDNLHWGTHAENMAEARMNHYTSVKFGLRSEVNLRQRELIRKYISDRIREMYFNKSITLKGIGEILGRSESCISRIVNRICAYRETISAE